MRVMLFSSVLPCILPAQTISSCDEIIIHHCLIEASATMSLFGHIPVVRLSHDVRHIV
ncbi:MAG: hypothetical protein IJQ95_01845 [Paludibacteraceae bacterium]|nr:hypothetical protein [Paludibacteraceae bacterium]